MDSITENYVAKIQELERQNKRMKSAIELLSAFMVFAVEELVQIYKDTGDESLGDDLRKLQRAISEHPITKTTL